MRHGVSQARGTKFAMLPLLHTRNYQLLLNSLNKHKNGTCFLDRFSSLFNARRKFVCVYI